MKGLLVIDVQNDYFPGGKLPLWNTEATLNNIEAAVLKALTKQMPVIFVQQFTDPQTAEMFNEGTEGAEIHPRLKAVAPDAHIVVKAFADSFYQTNLDELLTKLNVTTLLVCGMMTQNCVTHTAISRAAEKYEVFILSDCCTTVSALIHNIALRAVTIRLPVVPSNEVL